MRIYRLMIMVTLFSLWFASLADAALVNQVQFWIYGGSGSSGNGQVILDFSNFDFSGSKVPATLQYSVGNTTSWQNAGSTITLSGEQNQIFLQLYPNTSPIIASGNLEFMGADGNYFNGATVAWTGYPDVTVAVMGADKLSPTEMPGSIVPVPPPVFLFGSSLPGLFFARRKKVVV